MGWIAASARIVWQGRPWSFGLAAALLLGTVLRLLWGFDIEYKGDEAWTFERTQQVGQTEPFPWVGMPTSAGFANPGMSLWIFLGAAKAVAIHDPVTLARAVQLLNVVALVCLALFALRIVPRGEREPWLWAAALGALNPLAVLAQRKIWPPSVLPLFTLLMLAGWMHRRRAWAAFTWGLVGACLGQIHMAGFFFAGGFACWALFFDRRRVHWRAWFAGSLLGALPLIPWVVWVATQPRVAGLEVASRWSHLVEGKFWLRWVTEPLGVSVAYALEGDFGDFLSYPLAGGHPTYLMGLLHVLLAAIALVVLGRAAWRWWHRTDPAAALWTGKGSPTAFTLGAAVWGFGLLLTLSTMPIPRHYLWVAYPLGFVWLARLALGRQAAAPRLGRALLLTLCVVQGLITIGFLGYVHVNQRPLQGDFGTPYGVQVSGVR
jgi:hypothetical protein